jgi:hypothetical protein
MLAPPSADTTKLNFMKYSHSCNEVPCSRTGPRPGAIRSLAASGTDHAQFPQAANCQISKSGGLFARWPDPVRRRQAKRLAKMGDRGLSKIRKAKQCLVRHFAHLPDGLHAGREQRVLYPRWDRISRTGVSSGSSGVGSSSLISPSPSAHHLERVIAHRPANPALQPTHATRPPFS